MDRKDFLHKGMGAGAVFGSSFYLSALNSGENKNENREEKHVTDDQEVVIERPKQGKPHKGKVLLAIQPHSDDIPLFAGGTVAKLMDEGYTGYLLRTSDDSSGDVEGNRKDNQKVAEVFGMEKAYDFMYDHHRMIDYNFEDLKGRLIFIFRLLKVDTIVCYDPWGHYEENPDHYRTARAVEAARWMAGMSTDYPEHLDAGLEPYSPDERYYFARGPQKVNRVVDISNYIDKKVEANLANVTKGPCGRNGERFKRRLAEEGKELPILGETDYEANFNYCKHFVLDKDSMRLRWAQTSDREVGQKYGLEWGEEFHYIDQNQYPNRLEEYVDQNAVSR